MNTELRESLADHTSKNWRNTYDYLVSEAQSAIPDTAKFLKRVKWDLIAWRVGDECFYFRLTCYNNLIYRLRIDYNDGDHLPKTFWRIQNSDAFYRKCPEPKHSSELSFHYTEAQSIKGADLVRFVQDCFRCTDGLKIYRWPLFFGTGQWNHDYAWTVLGKIEQTKRDHVYHKEPNASCPLCQAHLAVTT
jgi:hypothetical protein